MLTTQQTNALESFVKENEKMYFEERQYDTKHFLQAIRFHVLGDEYFFKNLDEVTDVICNKLDARHHMSIRIGMTSYQRDCIFYQDRLSDEDLKKKYYYLAGKDSIALNFEKNKYVDEQDIYFQSRLVKKATTNKINRVTYSVEGKEAQLVVGAESSYGLAGLVYAIGYFMELAQRDGMETVKLSLAPNAVMPPSLAAILDSILQSFGFSSFKTHLQADAPTVPFIQNVIDFKDGLEKVRFASPSVHFNPVVKSRDYKELAVTQGTYNYIFTGFGATGLLSVSRRQQKTILAFHGLWENEGVIIKREVNSEQDLSETLLQLVNDLKGGMSLATLLEPPIAKLQGVLSHEMNSNVRLIMESFLDKGYDFEEVENAAARFQDDLVHSEFCTIRVSADYTKDTTLQVNFAYRLLNHYLLCYRDLAEMEMAKHAIPWKNLLFDTEEEMFAHLKKCRNSIHS